MTLGPHASGVVLDAVRTAPLPDPPERVLAGDALILLGWLATRRRPRVWSAPGFGHEVDLVRRHLAFVHGRATLAASFGREAFNVETESAARPDRATLAASPTRIAYALRWLELGDGVDRPRWRDVVAAEPAALV